MFNQTPFNAGLARWISIISFGDVAVDFKVGVGFRFLPCGFRLLGGGFRGFRLLAGPSVPR